MVWNSYSGGFIDFYDLTNVLASLVLSQTVSLDQNAIVEVYTYIQYADFQNTNYACMLLYISQ